MKPRQLVIDDRTNRFSWLVVFGGTLNEAIKIFAKCIHVEPWDAEQRNQYGHFAAHTSKKNGVIWFKKNKPTPSIVAHECFHAVMYFADKMELKVTEETEEVCAYYLEMLVREILEKTK